MATFTWRPDALDGLADAACAEFEQNSLHQVVLACKAAAPIDSGVLRDNIVADTKTGRGIRTEWMIRSRAVSDGGYNYPQTIILGRGEVRPVNATVLRWVDKRTKRVVFARRSGPVRGNNYLARGLRNSGLIRVRDLS